MKKYTIISYTAPDEGEKLGVVIASLGVIGNMTQKLCYGNHTLFVLESFINHYQDEIGKVKQEEILSYGGILVKNAILPDCDRVLKEVENIIKEVRHL